VSISIEPLDFPTAQASLRELLAIDAVTLGEPWGPDQFLADRPEKWQCSRLARDADGGTVGFAIASRRNGLLHVHRIAVRGDRAGAGVGSRLLGAVADEARRRGLSRVSLKVSRNNAAARRFYRRLGFRIEQGASEPIEMSMAAPLLSARAFRRVGSRSWRRDFRRDLERVRSKTGGSFWKLLLTERGLWAILMYRLEAAAYASALPAVVRRPVRGLLTLAHLFVEVVTGVSLPCTARIGPGLHIPHAGGIVLHADATLGEDCGVSQGVTVGVSGRGDRRGVPIIGDRVYLGAHSVVAGPVWVGDGAVVGANSLVTRDVPPGHTVLGVPAAVVSDRDSRDYL
jgi:serine O-acetyltransferase